MQSNQKPEKRRWQILVVDDEPAVCEAIKMMVEHDGHEVRTAGSGEEALSLLAQQKFDLVITDYSMPEMRGDELADIVKQRRPGQPVLMITAHAAMLKASGKPLAGVDFMMSKPFLLKDLREAIAAVLPESES